MSIRELIKDRFSPATWIKDALFGGIGAVSIAMMYQFFEVLKSQPALLLKWGPNFVLWMLGITIVGILGNRLIDVVQSSGDRLVESTTASTEAHIRNADGMRMMAEGIQRIADQGDGQMREIQAQTAYVATEIVRVMDRMTEQDAVLAEILAEQKKSQKAEDV